MPRTVAATPDNAPVDAPHQTPDRPPNRWLAETGGTRGEEYAARFAALAARGQDMHGEAELVDRLLPRGARVLDAGCGIGRVGIELTRRGHHVAGVDLDASMLAVARRVAPGLAWVEGDLADLDGRAVGAPFDAVVMAGNVVVYLTPGTEPDVVRRLASWLRPGGLLVAGFATDRDVPVTRYDRWCQDAGLVRVADYGDWDGGPPGGTWTVQVHRLQRPDRPAGAGN